MVEERYTDFEELRRAGFILRHTSGNDAALVEKNGKQHLYYSGRLYPYDHQSGINSTALQEFGDFISESFNRRIKT